MIVAEYLLGAMATVWTLLATAAISVFAVVHAPLFGPNQALYDRVIFSWCRSIVWMSGARVQIDGLDRLPRHSGYLLMTNHASLLDIPFTYYLLYRVWRTYGVRIQLRMLAKIELYRIPVFGAALRASAFIPIDRRNLPAAMQSYARVRAAMDAGCAYYLAPEGRRSADGRLLPFKKGGFVTAIESGADIVPVALHGLHRVLPRGGLVLRALQPVGITVGPVVVASQYRLNDRDALMARVHSWFADTLAHRPHPAPAGVSPQAVT